MATNNTATLTLTAVLTYLVLIALIVTTLVGAYVVNFVPSFVGLVGLSVGLLAFAGFLTQDLQGTPVPSGWPRYTTFFVVTIVAGLEAAIGVSTSQTFLTLGGVLGWLLFLVQFVVNALNSDAGANIPSATEMEIVALLGIVVTLITGFTGHTNDAIASLTVTTTVALPGYVHVREMANARSAARGLQPYPTR